MNSDRQQIKSGERAQQTEHRLIDLLTIFWPSWQQFCNVEQPFSSRCCCWMGGVWGGSLDHACRWAFWPYLPFCVWGCFLRQWRWRRSIYRSLLVGPPCQEPCSRQFLWLWRPWAESSFASCKRMLWLLCWSRGVEGRVTDKYVQCRWDQEGDM